ENTETAVDYLKNTKGNILSTIGSKELAKFINCGFIDRLYTRVLPLDASLAECKKAEILPSHIIAMQGPFTYELNCAMIKAFDIKIMLSKDSGKKGGFEEKLKVSKDMGLELVLIKKPEQKEGVSLSSAQKILAEKFLLEEKRKVFVIACGLGGDNLITPKALDAIKKSDLVIGAKRLIEELNLDNKKVFSEIYSDKIIELIENNSDCQKIALVFTGDIGFYSGAKKIYEKLKNIDIEPICGISSPIYLCSKLRTTWEDIKLVSLHGRQNNIISKIRDNKKVFTLLGGENNVNYLCNLLCEYNMSDVVLNIGENLSYKNEKITTGTAEELKNMSFSSLSAALIINENADNTLRFGLADELFERVEKVPMTKSDVRAVTISKLKLKPNSVVYDVGAGTGSVSIEIALNATDGRVYAIEKNENAVPVIEKNKIKFKADNIEIIEGYAPECLSDLPVPSHVFVGGSCGNLREIVNVVLEKNPLAKFVINTVTLETLSEAMEISKEFKANEIIEISSAKARKLGRYNLMTANNPIYVISFGNEE
ncbi:MAG: precorrin-6y C5,15-methyltransferase (decarboxylating) subunit CbiE, partial [Clostridia bacterium]